MELVLPFESVKSISPMEYHVLWRVTMMVNKQALVQRIEQLLDDKLSGWCKMELEKMEPTALREVVRKLEEKMKLLKG